MKKCNKYTLVVLDVASHLHGLAFFIVTRKQQTQFLSKFIENQKSANAHFINKIICLLKLLNFLFTHFKLIMMNSKHKIINIYNLKFYKINIKTT